MATGREERMQQRMRGAGRHEVADDSFGFVLPVDELSSDPAPLPQTRSEPNTSAKRRRLNGEPTSANQHSSSPSASTRSSSRLSNGQGSARVHTLRQEAAQRPDSPRLNSPPTTVRISARLRTLNLNQDGTPRTDVNDDPSRSLLAAETVMRGPQDQGDLEVLPDPTPQNMRMGSRLSSASKASDEPMMDLMEEVTESPAAAPGSGRRRRIEHADLVTRSVTLQRMVMEEEAGIPDEITTSSPLTRKSRKSNTSRATMSAWTAKARTSKTPSSPLETVPESSPLSHHSRKNGGTPAESSIRSTRSQIRRSALSTVVSNGEGLSSPPDAVGTSSPTRPRPTPQKKTAETPHKSPYEISGSEEESQQPAAEPTIEAVDEANDELAEEIDDHEVANRLGRKRLRISPRQKQPFKVAVPPVVEVERPAKRKRPRQEKVSPAKQAQPKAIKKKKKPLARRKSDGDSIPITVQRYTKPLRQNDGDTDEDILNTDIPFTDHKSPNVVDVVLQICEESIEKYLSAIHQEASQADGPARKILRTKLRTVEAFQEELRTRLQAQTIALDNLRTLKKRVRATQKEKLSLRNEILRIRAEREQVALKIDTVRMRHETANKETLHQLGLSSKMDDIELAIENGKTAPEPNAKERKMAELANLDLRISQIANQIGAATEGGGALKQIKEFNMLLERAAIALEGR